MLYLAGGFLVAIAAVAVPLMLLPGMSIRDFEDIALSCKIFSLDAASCKLGAQAAGSTMLAGLAIALLISLLAARRFPASTPVRPMAPWVFVAAAAWVAFLVTAHVAWNAASPRDLGYLSRGTEITRESNFVSLEALTWPLLLQLMNNSVRMGERWFFFALVMPLVQLSPYRATLFALIIFAVLLPLLEAAWRRIYEGGLRRKAIARYALVIAVAAAVLGGAAYYQTVSRVQTLGYLGAKQQLASDAQHRLEQRITYPLFQAHFAKVISADPARPSLGSEILSKLRLASGPDLGQYLYGFVYGRGSVGGMTTLYYGEAAVYSGAPPLVWVVTAPLLIVLAWLLLRRSGYETGTVMGIAVWRGSLGGLVPSLPAIALQLAALVILGLGRRGAAA